MVSTHESDTDGVASDVGLFEATDAEDNASDAGGNAGLQCSGQRFGCRPLKRLPSAPPASTSADKKQKKQAKKKLCKACNGDPSSDVDPGIAEVCRLMDLTLEDEFPGDQKLLLWGEKALKGRLCRHCRGTHRRIYPGMTVCALMTHIAFESEKETFKQYRQRAIFAFAKGLVRPRRNNPNVPWAQLLGNLRARLESEDEAEPAQEATFVHRSRDCAKRRGQWIRLDVFTRKHPDKKPDHEKVVWRTSRDGNRAQWIKVYNEEDGIEDFSEAEEDIVDHKTTLDNGEDILDEDQVQTAAETAKKMRLQKGEPAQFIKQDLAPPPPPNRCAPPSNSSLNSTPPKALHNCSAAAKRDEEGSDEESSEGEVAAPLHRGLRIPREKSEKPAAKAAADKATPNSKRSPQDMLAEADGLMQRFKDLDEKAVKEAVSKERSAASGKEKGSKKRSQPDGANQKFEDEIYHKMKEMEKELPKVRKMDLLVLAKNLLDKIKLLKGISLVYQKFKA